jgi:diguanylate cyclase (GGDEF)-like protein
MTYQESVPLRDACIAVICTAIVGYIYSLRRRSYLLYWTTGLAIVALSCLGHVFSRVNGTWPVQTELDQFLSAAAGIFFFLGAQLYAGRRLWSLPAAAAGGVLVFWTAANALAWIHIPLILPLTGIFFAVAYVFWQESLRQETLADWLLAVSFVVWAVVTVGFYFVHSAPFQTAASVPFAFVAMFMIIAFYEEERRRVERNMLALSNLNLATSSFVGAEIQRMLAQALDRVLGVVRLPAGALFLHHGDPQGPIYVVSAGLSDVFCRTMQEQELDDYLVGLVSRLGGLLGFRDLRKIEHDSELEREEFFLRFRKLALDQGLRSMVVISLQAKEQAFGVLLLGTPKSRRFTPAEYRLLLALGHQIGMAVENSYLIQQTSRRSEELHVLNEIGRALSSTLNKEDLLRKVWEELRRLFDVENFYIGALNPLRDEMRFDIEVISGVLNPPRSRRAGNYITEYIIRTRQPVLIRENYVAAVKKLGVEPIQQRGCYCGVPLVAYDQAIGVIAVFSEHERVFDEGHLELMRILASEASIAIENARLFHEERTKARHLSLLNAISRNAIATLNPDEMLARIAEQLEGGLTYDHIGISVLEYSTRELVVQAEAGARRGALGRRVPMGNDLIGHVARTGQLGHYQSSQECTCKPLFSDSVSAIALPVFYAEQLHGVLYVESSCAVEFSEEEILLLRTLADLIAGTLHNALLFQKAQEQATTDSLTGLKSYHFFEAVLSTECKSAKKNGIRFSVILLDLDHFKEVNDSLGHLSGDAVLQRVGSILNTFSTNETTAARQGGDEFVLIARCLDSSSAMGFAEHVREALNHDEFLGANGVTASIGVSVFPDHGIGPRELVKSADTAMYKSKRSGGNRVSMVEIGPSSLANG